MKKNLKFEAPHVEREEYRRHKPSQEFLDAETPFEYNFVLPGGEKLEAFQSKRGGGSIVIKRGNEVVLDFSELLPEGFKFVTPTYFKKHPKDSSLFDYFDNSWGASMTRKMILLGELKKPQDLLTLFHEIGHSHDDSSEDVEELERIGSIEEELATTKDLEYKVLLSEDLAKLKSKKERKAWAGALRILRKIQRESGVDLRSLFPTFDDLKKYMNEALATYRRSHEWIIKQGYDEGFYKELQRLFDRWQYEE